MWAPLALGRTEAHLYCARDDEISAPELVARYRELLSPEEDAACRRYVHERDRHRYLVTRALVRTTLSRYAEVEPRAWQFVANEHGRPRVLTPETPGLEFNVAHSGGMICCLVGQGRELGVDVEDTERSVDTMQVARGVFAPSELAGLERLSGEEQRRAFFETWTLKEAYIKARGMGLALPLAEFAFAVDAGRPRVAFEQSFDGDPRAWQFELIRPTPRHLVAVAIRRHTDADLRVVMRSVVPLVGS